MPASDISRITHSFPPGVADWARAACASLANNSAKDMVRERINSGAIPRNNPEVIHATFKTLYYQEYYRNMEYYERQTQAPKVIYVESENRAARKFYGRHTVANFSRMNCFIHVHRDSITVGRFNYPLDGDESPETKEALISAWPGPLDKIYPDERLKLKLIGYIDTLSQHDSQRRIKYCSSTNDDQRKDLLNLLRELLRGNGSIDAADITRLLLGSQSTSINKDESNRKPIETIQKYLLLGNRGEAIKFARSKRLYDHAQCLAFLDRYQPPYSANYIKDDRYGPKLKDDPIVQLNDEYIHSVDYEVLNTVYRSLLNRILATDPESLNIIKRPNVGNDSFKFAILSANDCEMDFDQSNEIFKLIKAIKQVRINPVDASRHLISLGYTYLERSPHDLEPIDDMSMRSHLSFRPGDTYATRTLVISNSDMLILNEIWEHCLNLAKSSSSYEYIIDLIPYKLVFASRLFDYGLHSLFAQYLNSIRNALNQARAQQFAYGDPFYDWSTIERSVEHLYRTWELFQSPDVPNHAISTLELMPFQSNTIDSGYNVTQAYEPVQPALPVARQNEMPYYDYASEHNREWDVPPVDARENQPPPTVIAQDSYPAQPYNMQPLSDQLYSLPDLSRTQSRSEYPEQSRVISESDHKAMKSSSPVDRNRGSMGDSFPFSPIQDTDDLQSQESSRRASAVPATNDVSNNEHPVSHNQINTANNVKSQSSGDKQANFFSNLVGTAKSLIPKNNSKQMILPDDTDKNIYFDSKLGKWVNREEPNGGLEDELPEAPPMMSSVKPLNYSLNRSTRGRYPTPGFH